MEEIRRRRKCFKDSLFSRTVTTVHRISLTPNETSQNIIVENSTANQQDKENVQESPRKGLKYYFNRFKYYHYCLAEKVDTLIGVVCFTIIKIYFSLMGWGHSNRNVDGVTDEIDVEGA